MNLVIMNSIIHTYRWDIAAIEQLPNYMKKCFKALNEISNEIGYKIYKKHGLNPIESLKKTVYKLSP